MEHEMTLAEFEAEVLKRVRTDADPRELVHNMVMGLIGELGEVVEPLKKQMHHRVHFDEQGVTLNDMQKECGDLLWYVTALPIALRLYLKQQYGGTPEGDALIDSLLSLPAIAAANVAKLRARYPESFTYGGGNRAGE